MTTPDIPEGYTYQRCDQYTPEEFLKKHSARTIKQICKEYIKENPKEFYNTDDEIAIHDIMRGVTVSTYKHSGNLSSTKRYKRSYD